jgi:hypothetical protein
MGKDRRPLAFAILVIRMKRPGRGRIRMKGETGFSPSGTASQKTHLQGI